MIEKPPILPEFVSQTVYKLAFDKTYQDTIEKINDEYLYWDKVKYHVPTGVSPKEFWYAIKIKRTMNASSFKFPCCRFYYSLTNHMQELLHTFDLNFGGSIASEEIVPEKNRKYYLQSSIMEEAIASSQMEGASTTRIKAKEMLRQGKKPRNIDQQMILNNYQTISFLCEHEQEKLTPDFLRSVHQMITKGTLDKPEDEGQFRKNDEIKVVDGISGEIVHIPPTFKTIDHNIDAICEFVNDETTYIHPIIKGIILHFLIAYLHPFADGNGRTARALFYWFMLKKEYWLMEYMSISRIIYKNNKQYSNAYLYCENDSFDLGYFINYNLETLLGAFKELQKYLEKKLSEDNAIVEFKNIPGINERQATILKQMTYKPNLVLTCKELESIMDVSVKTIRSDLDGLVDMGFLVKVAKNRRLTGYAKCDEFEKNINKYRGNKWQ